MAGALQVGDSFKIILLPCIVAQSAALRSAGDRKLA